ncbi:latrophilin Cirl isoform X3 [Drosophila gunungcola]|uniref:latrophilin Cirl isoform X3 n=1 Tax=Drosophila gunungcola TaxID=103775 RepID=UPI0022E1B94D|nr:latrophilin Cirl isoform X3 [Drosophila gunungcola]
MFPKSLSVLNSRCAHKQSCGVLAATSMFGDPCPGTHKYLEAHYQCISAAQTSTTTNRPSPPPWVLSNGPPIFGNGSGLIHPPGVGGGPPPPPRLPTLPGVVGISGNPGLFNVPPQHTAVTHSTPSSSTASLGGGRLKGVASSTTTTKHPAGRHDGLPPPPQLHHHHNHHGEGEVAAAPTKPSSKLPAAGNATAPSNTRILTGVGGSGTDDGTLLTTKSSPNRPPGPAASGSAVSGNNSVVRTINNINLNAAGMSGGDDESKLFCGPTHARNLFWNMTRVGDVNVQPCPGGAAGIAKWRCVLMKRMPDSGYDEYDDDPSSTSSTPTATASGGDCLHNSSSCEPPVSMAHKVNQRLRNFEPTWHPMTPDLTQCRSLWLNNLEMRVNQRDSSLISIANDMSEVTSSKTLYGGDMLVTTKIIQTVSEKMLHDKETFPDQRQREAMIMELLHCVVKTGSNLLDESQLSSWLDLNPEDQMRVATSLLTGLEYNAFLLADTIIRERSVVQKVKNILLSVRVLETKTIQSSVVFPDSDQWPLSSDRIELPRAALIDNSEGGLVRIVFAAFDRLESILKPSYDHYDLKSSRSYVRNTAILANDSDANAGEIQQRLRILNSKVISASLGKGRHIQLSQPITLTLKHLKTENVTNPTCVFWNYIDHAWSANGCSLESTNRTHSVCSCNHLTNFAILMDVVDEHQHSLFTMFDGNMRIFIYISIAICVVFIVIALLTLKLFNGVFVKVRNGNNPLPHQRAGSSRRQQNNIRDQTHESLTLTTPTSHQTNVSPPSHGHTTNFIQHNSIRNSHRNNLNFNVQQQQQQQQQQVVAAAAAAVVLSNQPQRNMQHAMNNLNLNLHQHGQQTAAAAAAAASIAAALQQHAVQASNASNNLNISHNYLQQQQQQQHQQQQHQAGPLGESYYHQPDYYSWKQPPTGAGGALKGQREYYNNAGAAASSPQQAHEVFYWTQKPSSQHGKKKRGGAGGVPASPSGSLHSRTAAASQVLFYPSYKKTKPGQQAGYPQYAEALDPPQAATAGNAAVYYQQQQQLRRQQQQQLQQQQQQQQLSSDEEQAEQHAHLLHLQRRAGGQQQLPAPPPHMAQYQQEFMQRQYRNKHSNCDLGMGDAYYNQGGADGGPVYEEILSNRNSDVQHYEVGDFDVDEVYNNSVGTGVFNNMRAAVAAGGSRYGGGSLSGGSVSSRSQQQQQQQQQLQKQQQQQQSLAQQRSARRCTADDDDDEDDDDEEEDEEATAAEQLHDSVCDEDEEEDESDLEDDAHGLPPQSDERMRRLMAMQDEDFKRRFQRQLRKHGAPLDYGSLPPGSAPGSGPHPEHNGAVFGVSGGVGEGSMRGAFRQQQPLNAKSPGARLAVNELFGHGNAGPPLPPANQTPAQKRQQLQKLSPQSTTSSSSHTSHTQSNPNPHQLTHPHPQPHPQPHPHPHLHPPHHQQRHLSAMLDENNTVRCYLEPLAK